MKPCTIQPESEVDTQNCATVSSNNQHQGETNVKNFTLENSTRSQKKHADDMGAQSRGRELNRSNDRFNISTYDKQKEALQPALS